MKQLNPNWEYRLYGDLDVVDFIRKFYGLEMLSVYESINPSYGAARADLFRYLLIYETGGLYLDIKSKVTISLDSVISEEETFIFSLWDQVRYPDWGKHLGVTSPEIQNWFLLAEPKNRLLGEVIDQVVKGIKSYHPLTNGVGKFGTLRLTGPIKYTSVLRNSQFFTDAVYKTNEELGFEYSIYSDPIEHKNLFVTNYANCFEPIIKSGSGRDYIYTKFFQMLYKIGRTVKYMKSG